MLAGVCIGTNNIEAAGDFYDRVLATIGMLRVVTETNEIGYAAADGKVTVYLIVPYNGDAATFGNGTQFMFYATDKKAVDQFHATAISCGGKNEGTPGPRDYHPKYYGAYVRDLDGNKLNVAITIEDSRP